VKESRVGSTARAAELPSYARMRDVNNTVQMRAAEAPDASVIASVYNEGIAGREATFETEPRHAADFLERIASQRHLLLVAELERQLVGWAGLAPYSERAAYAGIGEASIYVARSARRKGVGTQLCRQLAEDASATPTKQLPPPIATNKAHDRPAIRIPCHRARIGSARPKRRTRFELATPSLGSRG
jgi:L-amino acid N-acyltransferase YncA